MNPANSLTPSRKNPSDAAEALDECISVLQAEGEALLECAKQYSNGSLHRESLQNALGLLFQSVLNGGKIVVTGLGKSGKIAQKLSATFCSTGSQSVFLHPTEALHGDLGVVQVNDVVLALSHRGNSDEMVQLVRWLKPRGVKVIGVGSSRDSALGVQCDVWLDTWVVKEACPLNLAPTTSTTVSLALGDGLAVGLMRLRQISVESFAQNHPSGALGRRLTLKVRDLMHADRTVGVLGPQAMMDEVIALSTEKKLGGVLIVENERLIGLITDGDIRRALRLKHRFFELSAKEIMNSSPVTIDPDESAYSALRLMEERSSQISVLPVVRMDGTWLGLLRLHDLVRAF